MIRSRLELWARAAAAALFFFGFASHAQTARQFMVAAAHPLAVDAGYAVLKSGGSAVDAAVAVQMVLGLVEPESSGIGGGAFMLYWAQSEKRLRSYDGRETAPAAARPDRFLASDARPIAFVDALGGRSVGVPGVLRMLELAHKRHGKLRWAELFQYAIFAAEEGFAMPAQLHERLASERLLRADPGARRIFYDADGNAKPAGARLVNPEYGATLRTIATRGADALYNGEIARDIVQAVRAHAKPGDLSEEDLAAYRALERAPVCGPYRGWRVCSMGPPSSGGIAVLQMLGILERVAFERAARHSHAAVHLFTEAGRLAYADRARYAGDPDFVQVPVARLLDGKYLDERARRIGERSMRQALPGDFEAGTSHFSIVDASGNAVAMTTTIESTFGSRIMVRGFLLNNQLTDFDFRPGGANEVAPRKRPRSSMAPTVVFEGDGQVRLLVGSPGGPNIINYVARALVATLDWGFDVQSAIALPNFGSRNGPTLLESGTVYETLRADLESRNHVVESPPLPSGLHAIERVPGGWRGGADPRREGAARGD
ncbi:MAG: gamma-glutamyltransferase [Betaproteobacteria bacterium RIFCSPLOWO2_12_FULL_65_14]|nr:MAG: gamma-glutamyltransferase [Betaproteobacteria bacterium RIFCSPLOWO2_12_FULL_65_14]